MLVVITNLHTQRTCEKQYQKNNFTQVMNNEISCGGLLINKFVQLIDASFRPFFRLLTWTDGRTSRHTSL